MTDDPLLGHQISNFRLERILGRGGMAQVYYGWDVKLERPVAVKVLDARFRNNQAYARRFVREAQAVATWRQENIGQVYYADEEGDLYYFAMEYIDGLDLGQLLSQYTAKNELMPQADIVRIGRAIASALDYAHSKNVVHRDVKPSNAIVAHDERVVLTDFGLALDVQQGSMGEVFGTAHYIAPEQAHRSADAIPQSDLYSLGIMLYEMLTGSVPFDDPSPTAVALQHITQPPPAPRTLNPDLNAETEAVLLKALSKSPHERYQTGKELITALENALRAGYENQPVPLPPLPAGMSLPAKRGRLSRMTVAEVIASQAQPASSQVTKASSSHVQRPPTRPQRQLAPWLTLGGCALASVVVVVILAGLLFSKQLSNLFQGAGQPANTETGPALASPHVAPSNTSPADAQSAEPLPEITDTSLPTELIVANESPTETPAPGGPPTIALLPTVKYPNGKRFMLFYDDNSLYLLNLSDSVIPINWVAFERLSDANVPLNRFDGSLWAKFYPDSKPGWCTALKILDSASYLDPIECGHDNLYLSLRTPTRDDPVVFWTVGEGSRQFRVLWREGGRDEEIARCEIGAGVCEVFLP